MALEQLPDWTDIGRDIGRKVRDILNPRHGDNGPTTEDRRAERLRDVLKGFAYFDTIDEVLEWTVDQVDPLQQANIPLVIRDTTRTSNLKPISKARTILCHDYKGGYKDYESVRPATLHEQLWHCEHLQYVDTFIYFSHKLVCVPPPSWTNLLHRNGIKVLGTFLTEPQNPAVDRLLSVTNGRYVLADVLAAMSHTYGFDGWVLNFEKKFSSNMTDKIVEFIEQLKTALGIGYQVIWYDALDIENRVRYQNGLSRNNLPFAQAADALFTNYRWTEEKLRETKDLVLTQSMDPANICFGIDVWAQNTNMPGPPRITFPPNGGGGTNTGLVDHLDL
jgi:endo-beta-N-acetylglucosaminidase D